MKRISFLRFGKFAGPAAIFLFFIGSVLLFRLGTLTGGLAGVENQLQPLHTSLQQIWNHPLNLPYILCQIVVAVAFPTAGYTVSRLPAVVLAAVSMCGLYWLMRRWYGRQLTFLSILIVISLPWFLHVARMATPAVSDIFAMTGLLVLAAAWHHPRFTGRLLALTVLTAPMVIYVPGMVWGILLVAYLERRQLVTVFRTKTRQSVIAIVVGLAMLVPLGHSIFLEPQYGLRYLGWQDNSFQILTYLRTIANVFRYLVIGGYQVPAFNLAGLPLLGACVTILVIVGIYLYSCYPKAHRTKLLGGLAVVGVLITSLPGQNSIILLLPLVAVLITAGLGYLLQMWLRIFPRNPIARGFGYGLMGIVIVSCIGYNLANYFIAWPHNQAVKMTFSRRL